MRFPDRHRWWSHEIVNHRFKKSYKCVLKDCGATCDSKEQFITHLETKHPRMLAKDESLIISECAREAWDLDESLMYCPFCKVYKAERNSKLSQHIAHHFEDQALLVLSIAADDGDDGEEEGTTQKENESISTQSGLKEEKGNKKEGNESSSTQTTVLQSLDRVPTPSLIPEKSKGLQLPLPRFSMSAMESGRPREDHDEHKWSKNVYATEFHRMCAESTLENVKERLEIVGNRILFLRGNDYSCLPNYLPIHYAISRGHSDMVELLASLGSPLQLGEFDFLAPLKMAVESYDVETVKKFLAACTNAGHQVVDQTIFMFIGRLVSSEKNPDKIKKLVIIKEVLLAYAKSGD